MKVAIYGTVKLGNGGEVDVHIEEEASSGQHAIRLANIHKQVIEEILKKEVKSK